MISHPAPWSALITLPLAPSASTVAVILALEQAILACDLEVVDTVPAFNALLVTGRPESWDPRIVERRLSDFAKGLLEQPPPVTSSPQTIELPACYSPALAPDLEAVAQRHSLTPQDLARIHAESTYTVLAVGFSPGFAYLGDLDSRLATPRRDAPRPDVAAGSVGLADRRTAVYPSNGPGGWQLIGRVPASLFADAEQRLARFMPGDQVRFRAITEQEFARAS
ncbi:MAG: 5-oxoprolinase subunit PxpB [Rhodothermales bacterium]|nr:5-oxoprolinase subunit PxpB [Rhodothermales bacterium]MBO6778323.1 5-oxoprolinase subunit PxpB [Rhodothermales bacterium]